MFQIKRYCGRERLPGGARLWYRMARLAGFTGTLYVYGYGVKGIGGLQQRQYDRGARDDFTIGDYDSELNRIRVWLPCWCSAAIDDPDDTIVGAQPLEVFAHELGHHRQHVEGHLLDEGGAENRGAHLLNAARIRG